HFGTKSKDTAALQAIGRDECGARAAALKRTYIDGQVLLVSLVAVCFNQQLRRSGLANATTKQPTGHNKLKNNYIAQARSAWREYPRAVPSTPWQHLDLILCTIIPACTIIKPRSFLLCYSKLFLCSVIYVRRR